MDKNNASDCLDFISYHPGKALKRLLVENGIAGSEEANRTHNDLDGLDNG